VYTDFLPEDSPLTPSPSDGYLSEPQIGGGTPTITPKRQRRANTPPQLTPTRLRHVIHRSDRDAGSVILNAQDRRAKLLQEPPKVPQPGAPPLPPLLAPGASSTDESEPHQNRLSVPLTNVIPPTPRPPQMGTTASGSPLKASGSDSGGSSSDFASGGRLSLENANLLRAGFEKIEATVQKLSQTTSLPVNQILALWDKKNGRDSRLGNYWNVYEGYLKDPANQAEEVRRAGFNFRGSSPFVLSSILY